TPNPLPASREVAMMYFITKESAVSRLALKIVVMTREQGTGKRFWATLLFVTCVGFFPFT
ncbi:MAG: hypothetical protein ACKOQS_25130, partial [Dolichospermum sp.]